MQFGSSETKPAQQELSERERARLLEYARRYNLESAGFAPAEARRLLFLDWLHRQGVVDECPRGSQPA